MTTKHKKINENIVNKTKKTLFTPYHPKNTSNHASTTNKITNNTTRQTFNNNHKKSIIACITNKTENNGNN